MKPNNTHKRGFASMTLERRREIAAAGGKAVAPDKRSFSQDRALAATAGRLGGLADRTVARKEGIE